MTELSSEQLAIINAPLAPLSVVACAGSGKTWTAVLRLAEMRRQLGAHRGRVALLSFSNVAVDTFRKGYQSLAQSLPKSIGRHRVEIDTLDGFITSNVLRPHAHRTMKSTQSAFVVMGTENFLNGFKFRTDTHPYNITQMQVGMRGGTPYFYYIQNDQIIPLETTFATNLVNRLGQTGAYTHDLGRYWCYRTLTDQPWLLRAMVQRYPHILIDESQDIGTLHQAILEQLIQAGTQVSLIGDPHQGIFEFAGADGKFLTQYEHRPNVTAYKLTCNYRSISPILTLANKLSKRTDSADRGDPDESHGAFFVAYKNSEKDKLIAEFQKKLLETHPNTEDSAVLCRGRDAAEKLAGRDVTIGQGIVKRFALASIRRDKDHDYHGAFKLVAACIFDLFSDPPDCLLTMMTQPGRRQEVKPLHRIIWSFTRNSDTGLPAASLTADSEWHPQLVARLKAMLADIEKQFDLQSTKTLGNKLAKKGLPNSPLMASTTRNSGTTSIRIETVHQVKGESLDGVLYMANKEHISAMLDGTGTELGRIGYVAVTRAKNLFWLGVPANALAELKPDLLAHGFQDAGIVLTTPAPKKNAAKIR